jgi:hypothetical protein
MAQIGGVLCTFVRGHCPQPKMRLMLWTVPGVDGIGAQAVGYNDSPFEVVAVLYSNALGIEAWKAALEGLQGTIVSITNDLGTTFSRCLITKVSLMRSIAALAHGGITQRGEIVVEGVVT